MKPAYSRVVSGFAGACVLALAASPTAAQVPHKHCLPTIMDQAVPGDCLPASSWPQFGHLYPLGKEFYIDPSGRVGIGTLNPAYNLDVQEFLRVRGDPNGHPDGTLLLESAGGIGDPTIKFLDQNGTVLGLMQQWGASSNPPVNLRIINTQAGYLSLHTQNTERVTVLSNGNVGIGTTTPACLLEVNGTACKPGGGSWSSSSDRRLKKDIEPLVEALDQLLALCGVSFEYKDPVRINELPGRQRGMIAQDVEGVFPEWVSEKSDGYKQLTFRGFEALTVEALRELRAEKDAEMEVLYARIAKLEVALDQVRLSR